MVLLRLHALIEVRRGHEEGEWCFAVGGFTDLLEVRVGCPASPHVTLWKVGPLLCCCIAFCHGLVVIGAVAFTLWAHSRFLGEPLPQLCWA